MIRYRNNLCFVVFMQTLCVLAANAFSAPVQITGIVKSSSAASVFVYGATVNLVKNTLSVSTAANGSFSITGNVTTGIETKTNQQEYSAQVSFRDNHLYFYTKMPGEKVTLQFFDLLGNSLQTISKRFSSVGPQLIDIGKEKKVAGVHIIRVNIDGQLSRRCSLVLDGDLSYSKTSFQNVGGISISENSLAKNQAAAVDTIKIQKDKYITLLIPITSFQLAMGTITLQFDSTCLAKRGAAGEGSNEGHACMGNGGAGGCHDPGSAGPGSPNPNRTLVTACGIVYNAKTGGSPIAGATVRLMDTLGRIVTLTTGSAGMFEYGPNYNVCLYGAGVPGDRNTKWVSAAVTVCPYFIRMPTRSDGNCLKCHKAKINQIHVP
jgi:hypothetical protein